MANLYSQLYVHIIIHIKNDNFPIPPVYQKELYEYAGSIIQGKGNKLIAIGGMPDHIHILVNLKTDTVISDLIQEFKSITSKYMNKMLYGTGKFRWQTGFCCFSYSYSHIDQAANYIMNQEKHHSNQSFQEEYVKILTRLNIDFDPRYLLELKE